MSFVASADPPIRDLRALASGYWPVLLGLAALYAPTYWDLAGSVWQTEEQGHGPIILAIVVWLVWQKGGELARLDPQPDPALGWPLLLLGLFVYAVGRSQQILLLEVGSHLLVLPATLLLVSGRAAVRTLWFPLLFTVFMVPLPGVLIDAMTLPLKQTVSSVAETILYSLGYPVARSGVVLTVGQYQLLVADACSGLNSMFSLAALGLLFLYLQPHRGWLHRGIVIAAILPIAFVANVVRVMILILVTYHLGDEAGQGFVHGFAGILVFVVALLLLFLLEGVLRIGAAAFARGARA
jgi:exosortase B